jgi:hypothetical protein
MIIVYGTRFFGRADVVPGVGHVACRFVHVMFCPLVPIETVFLLEHDGDETRGVKVPFSFKAALSGWVRGGAVLGAIASAVGAIVSFSGHDALGGAIELGGVGFSVGLFFAVGALFGRCSASRRAELLGAVGLEPASPAGPGAPMPGIPMQGPMQGMPMPAGLAPYGAAGTVQPAGGFGAPAHAPGYGAPAAGYGAPPGGYGPPAGYGGPPAGYGPPPQGHGAPPVGYGGYGAAPPPPHGYAPPVAGYPNPMPPVSGGRGSGHGPQGGGPSR